MSENLHVKVTGNGSSNLILLHGLFGAGNNLGQLARAFRDDFTVYSVDLPDHGKSPWSSVPSIEGYAKAVAHWLIEHDLPQAIVVGHSLGGKVAMQLALDFPFLVQKLVILDIAPITYSSRHDSVFRALNAVSDARVTSRTDARAILAHYLEEPRVADFLLTNAELGADGVLKWRFNLPGLQSGYERILGEVKASGEDISPVSAPTLVLRGELSDYVNEPYERLFAPLFSVFDVRTVIGAGHWLHQEKTAEVYREAQRFIDRKV